MRKITLGNRSLYLGFDAALCLREMFWPVVGLANHVAEGRETSFLLWYEGQVFNIGGENWETKAQYATGQSCKWRLEHGFLPLTIHILDAIDPYLALWQRKITVLSKVFPSEGLTELGLYSKQYYNLGENNIGESAFWDPTKGRLYHYKGRFWVGISFCKYRLESCDDGESSFCGRAAKRRDGGTGISNGTGEIQGQSVDHGLIDSIIGFRTRFRGRLESLYSLAMGSCQKEVDEVLDSAFPEIDKAEKDKRRQMFCAWYKSSRWWALKEKRENKRQTPDLYDVSVKVLFSHCDKGGAVLASLDQDIMGDYRDHYRYVWPRDAAMCVWALCGGGYVEPAKSYLLFSEKALADGGFFWQRLRPDGSRGSGWHPHTLPPGELPIQEDETALSLIAAKDYFRTAKDLDLISKVYPTFISRSAKFIMDYTQDGGAMVKPSYDLWEERRGVFSYTQAASAAALYAAFEIGWTLGDPMAKDFLEAGILLHQGLLERLSTERLGFFRGLAISGAIDDTPDASILLIPRLFFDVFEACDKPEAPDSGRGDCPRWGGNMQEECASFLRKSISMEMISATLERCLVSWKRVGDTLKVDFPQKNAMGIARYANDWYMRPDNAQHVPGNPWFVTTAWYLWSYLILKHVISRSHNELGKEIGHVLANAMLEGDDLLSKGKRFFGEFCLSTGILPEQVNALTGEPLSCAPLAWSHASFMDLLHLEMFLGWSPVGFESRPKGRW